MNFMIIFMAVGIALVLLFFFVLASRGQQRFPSNMSEEIDWSAINDAELQSYLPDQKINAIKRYRELTGMGLKESKDAVEYAIAHPDAKKGKRALSTDTGGAGVRDLLLENRIEEAVDVYAAFMGVDEFTARDVIDEMQRELDAETNLSADFDIVRDLLAEGKKIDAIKQYMTQTGTSLADAKRAVEEME